MFTKNNKSSDTTPTPSEPMKAAPAQDAIRGASSKPAARAASIICADMKINGSVSSEGALQIDGTVDGDVAASDITIGASGHITGEVKAEVVRVKGDIVHSSLQIQSNAVFEGQVKHADDPLKDTAPKAAAAANESKPMASSGPAGYGISPSAS